MKAERILKGTLQILSPHIGLSVETVVLLVVLFCVLLEEEGAGSFFFEQEDKAIMIIQIAERARD
jgi:hypothetical protein